MTATLTRKPTWATFMKGLIGKTFEVDGRICEVTDVGPTFVAAETWSWKGDVYCVDRVTFRTADHGLMATWLADHGLI